MGWVEKAHGAADRKLLEAFDLECFTLNQFHTGISRLEQTTHRETQTNMPCTHAHYAHTTHTLWLKPTSNNQPFNSYTYSTAETGVGLVLALQEEH